MRREDHERAYPLHWPEGIPRRSYSRRIAKFGTYSFARVRDELLHELGLLGARYMVLSSNIPLRQDGLPYSGIREPEDPGVAVYFEFKGAQRCMACDVWKKATDNVHALALTVAALRGIARWGSTDMVDRAFQGFQALPQPSAVGGWRTVLGFREDEHPTLDYVTKVYRNKAFSAHPDRGGDTAEMARLNAAMREAEQELSR